MGMAPPSERRRGDERPDLSYSVSLGREPGEVLAVRRDIRARAESAGFDGRAEDLELVVGELLANAQEHGLPPVEVVAWWDGRLLVRVLDRGHGFDRWAVWSTHPPRAGQLRGRGLWIARQLTDGVSVRVGREGTSVTVELGPEPQIGA